ncbi:MAG: GNAT family N-acetyltransferase [Ruminococcaceae bacterium]|nr:GNAT family N-acetyltransferase [Oscillospiraceae bacterium]
MDNYTVIHADTQQLLDECRRVRHEVFVLERGVDPSIEQDGHDILGGACAHFLIRCGDSTAGAFRCMTDGGVVRLQRLCVAKAHRKKGAGAAALKFMEQHYRALGCSRIELDSKCESAEFYLKNGYTAVSEPFIEADIPHIRMIKEL